MKLSLEASLQKLRTTYIDIFYVHIWDLHTSVEEIMDSLHVLVLSGKVLYLVGSFHLGLNFSSFLLICGRESRTARRGS